MAPKDRRKRLSGHLRKAAGFLDVPTYAVLLLGEMIQSHSDEGYFMNKIALWIAKGALPLAKSRERLVAPITHLAVGYSHYMVDEFDSAATHLRKARGLFQQFPDSPYKQYYLGRCLVHLCRTLDQIDADDEQAEVAAEAKNLLRNLVEMTEQKTGRRGKDVFCPKSGDWGRTSEGILFKVTHVSPSWWRGCLYSLIELSKIYVHANPSAEAESHQKEVVSLLLKTPVFGDDEIYFMERGLADCLFFHGKYEESLKVWRRLQKWNFYEDEDEERDDIQYHIINCLAHLYRHGEAIRELGKLDLTHSLVHYQHGPRLLSLVRQLYYRTGQYDKILRLSRSYYDLCYQKWGILGSVTLSNCFYFARMLKKVGNYPDSIGEFRSLLRIVDGALWPFDAEFGLLLDMEFFRTLPPFRAETRRSLGHVLRLSGHVQEAIYHYHKALDLEKEEDTVNYKQIRGTLKSIGHLYEVLGDDKNASIAYDQLHREYAKKSKQDDFAIMKFYYYRGRMFLLMGEFGVAAHLFEKAASAFAQYLEQVREATDDQSPAGEAPHVGEGESIDEIAVVGGRGQQSSAGVEEAGTPQVPPSKERKCGPAESVHEISRETRNEPTPPVAAAAASAPAPVPPRELVVEPVGTSRDDAARERPAERATATDSAGVAESTESHFAAENTTSLDEAALKEAKAECDRRDAELEDRYPFGSNEGIDIHSPQDGWWPRIIGESMEAARNKESHQRQVPPDRYDSDSDEELDEDEDTIADTDISLSPIGKRTHELVIPKFEKLPDDYDEIAKPKRERERYPWRFMHS